VKRGGVMGAGAIMAQRQVKALLNKKKVLACIMAY
jgi:hypothetical protein